MKEFIEKLIGRLEEGIFSKDERLEYDTKTQEHLISQNKGIRYAIKIVNELAEEYENDFCEWKVDGVYLMCQHKTELFVSCLEDEKYRYKHCPICGKKIKAVE